MRPTEWRYVLVAALVAVACVAEEDVGPVALNPDEVGTGKQGVGEAAYASGNPVGAPGRTGEEMYSTEKESVKAIEDEAGNVKSVTLAKPYESKENLKNNKDAWTALGGWPAEKNKELEDAKKAVGNAQKYVKIAFQKKEMSEIACPCEGEKYYEIIQSNAGKLEDAFQEQANAEAASAAAAKAEMEALAAQASSYGSGAGGAAASLANKALDSNAHHSSWATFKKMLAKYGQLGPQSTWQPIHDVRLKLADGALKRAQRLEDQLMTKALPEFKQVKKDFPEIFTNGKCPCPAGWTIGDAAVLAAKFKDDAVAVTSHAMKIVRHLKRDPTAWYDPVSGRSMDKPRIKNYAPTGYSSDAVVLDSSDGGVGEAGYASGAGAVEAGHASVAGVAGTGY